VTIQYVELDDDNVPHATRHGVTLTEIETLLLTDTLRPQQAERRQRLRSRR